MQSLWGCAYEMRSLGDVNYKITKLFYKHDSKTLKLVHKFILLLEFDFLPTYLLHFKRSFRTFPLF
jgi:hypothetical protein